MVFPSLICSLSLLLVITLFTHEAAGRIFHGDPCLAAYRRCNFRFKSTIRIPAVSLAAPYDRAVSRRIISKKHGESIGYVNYTHSLGVLNSNNIPAEVINRRGSFPITFLRSSPPLTPTHIKPFPIPYTTGSGVGFQTLTETQRSALRGRCIRLFFTEYQVLNSDGTVKENFNNVPRYKNKCVVFRPY